MAEKSLKLTDAELEEKVSILAKRLVKEGRAENVLDATRDIVAVKMARIEALKEQAKTDQKKAKKMERDAKNAQARLKEEQARKDDTTMKIIAGAIALKAVENDPDKKAWLFKLLDAQVLKNAKRDLFKEQFGLKPLAQEHNDDVLDLAREATPATSKAQEKANAAPSGPASYNGYCFKFKAEFLAHMPDFPKLSFIAGHTADEAKKNMADAARAHVADLGGLPVPLALDDARHLTKANWAKEFEAPASAPELEDLKSFTVEIPR